MRNFAPGDRVISSPGLHWLKQRVTGTVIEANPSVVIVLLDFPNARPGSRCKRRLSFSRKNLEHA
jgi:hypothetical protein